MDFSLRRHVWVIDLIGIMFGAGLAGHAVATRLAPALPDDGWTPTRVVRPAARAASMPAFAPTQPMREQVLARVRRLGPRLYEVPRGILDQLGGLRPPAPVIVPEMRDGKAVGFGIFGIAPDSLPAALGLANGDVVIAANGLTLADPDSALAAYAAFQARTHAWLVIERRRQRVRIDYVIR